MSELTNSKSVTQGEPEREFLKGDSVVVRMPHETCPERYGVVAKKRRQQDFVPVQFEGQLGYSDFHVSFVSHIADVPDGPAQPSPVVQTPEFLVTVCDKCLQATCWQGLFYCDDYKTAGTVDLPVSKLREMARENPCYWKDTGLVAPVVPVEEAKRVFLGLRDWSKARSATTE